MRYTSVSCLSIRQNCDLFVHRNTQNLLVQLLVQFGLGIPASGWESVGELFRRGSGIIKLLNLPYETVALPVESLHFGRDGERSRTAASA